MNNTTRGQGAKRPCQRSGTTLVQKIFNLIRNILAISCVIIIIVLLLLFLIIKTL